MTPPVEKLGGKHVDSFQLRTGGSAQTCWWKGCQRRGRVKLFYTKDGLNQTAAFVCINHALDLANDVLNTYKFKR